jgi:NodT family efflux transporter outer membrane factor (OMF) lipoprotein
MARYPLYAAGLIAAVLLDPAAATAGPETAASTIAGIRLGKVNVPAPDSWWRAFNDPVLSALVELAISESPSIEQAAARFDRARAGARATRASLLPQIGAGAGATAIRQSLEDPVIRPFASFPGFQRDIARYEANLSASWEIDLFGTAPRLRASRASASAAQADLAGVRIAVAGETAAAFLNVRELQARIVIAQRRTATLDRERAALGLRVAAGTLAPIDFDRVEGEAESAAAVLPMLEALLASEIARLGVLVGDADAARTAADMPLQETEAPYAFADGLQIGIGQRPDVVAAQARLTAADADVEVAKSQRWPKLSLGALLATVAAGPASLFMASSTAARGGASVVMPLLDFGRIDAAIADARGARREALAIYRQALLQAAADVEVATETLARRRVEAERQLAAAAALDRAEASAIATYNAGVLDLTSLLDTQRTSLAARENVSITRSASNKALVALFRATAGIDSAGSIDLSVSNGIRPN